MNPIRILIADDHDLVRKGIRMIASTEPSVEVVGEARNGHEAVLMAESLQPDVVLMDLVMPGDGLLALARLKQNYPQMKVVVLTTYEDTDRVRAAIDQGADGYLLKDADGEALLAAVQAVYRGEMPLHPRVTRQLVTGEAGPPPARAEHLTEREKMVLHWLIRGLSNREIARKLSLSRGTVKIYVSNILGKLQVSTRTEAAVRAVQLGLEPPDEDIT